MPSIKVYNTRNVDELILLDITATTNKRDLDYSSILEYSTECIVPFTYGGGIDSLDKIRNVLYNGADKVSINTYAYKNPALISDAANRFGSQCIVISIDVKKNGPRPCVLCSSRSGRPGSVTNKLQCNCRASVLIFI